MDTNNINLSFTVTCACTKNKTFPVRGKAKANESEGETTILVDCPYRSNSYCGCKTGKMEITLPVKMVPDTELLKCIPKSTD
jgi:hypothetical protein